MTQSVDIVMRVEPADAEADAQDVSRLVGQLRRELLQLEVDRVELLREEAPPDGAKPAEVFALGAVLVTVAPELIAGVCDIIAAWLSRSAARSVELEINGQRMKITGASRRDTERFVAEFRTMVQQTGGDSGGGRRP